MNRTIRIALAAATLGTSLFAGAARAHDRDDDWRGPRPAPVYEPAPVFPVRPIVRPIGENRRRAIWEAERAVSAAEQQVAWAQAEVNRARWELQNARRCGDGWRIREAWERLESARMQDRNADEQLRIAQAQLEEARERPWGYGPRFTVRAGW